MKATTAFAGLICLSLAAIAAQDAASSHAAGCKSIRETKDSGPTPDDIRLPAGALCTIHTVRGEYRESVEGELVRATSEWIILRTKSPGHSAGIPILNKVPNKTRLFKNTGVHHPHSRPKEVWVPRDSVLYFTVELQDDVADGGPLPPKPGADRRGVPRLPPR